VGEDDDGRRRVAEVVRELEPEAVVVEEDGVERAVEEGWRHGPLEVVEAEVEEAERGEVEDDGRERADEAVVAEVELVEEAEAAERGREDAAEAVGVEVEQREVGEEAELRREEPRDVAVVEVDPGDGELPAAARRGGERGAEDAGVVADVRAHPVGGEVLGVGEDGLPLPRLQRDVRVPQPPVREPPPRVRLHLRRPPLPLRRLGAAAAKDGGGGEERQEHGSSHLISLPGAAQRSGGDLSPALPPSLGAARSDAFTLALSEPRERSRGRD
jgi:hypothetical protein